MDKQLSLTEQGQLSYEQWRKDLLSDPEFRAIYEEEAAKSALWLQLVEARQAAGSRSMTNSCPFSR